MYKFISSFSLSIALIEPNYQGYGWRHSGVWLSPVPYLTCPDSELHSCSLFFNPLSDYFVIELLCACNLLLKQLSLNQRPENAASQVCCCQSRRYFGSWVICDHFEKTVNACKFGNSGLQILLAH